MIVVDASWLVDWLLGRPEAVAAVEAGGSIGDEALHAPELVDPEALNALRRLVAGGELSERRADEAVADLAAARIVRYPHAPLRRRIWTLRHELSAYDATYLALAESVPEPTLLTGDEGLAAAARRHLPAGAVRKI